jgi:PIN domain-containing protein
MSPSKALSEIKALRRLFDVLPHKPEVLDLWQLIVSTYGVLGKQTHDAHLVAMMQAHSITSILTFDGNHFKRYTGIAVLDPARVEYKHPLKHLYFVAEPVFSAGPNTKLLEKNGSTFVSMRSGMALVCVPGYSSNVCLM